VIAIDKELTKQQLVPQGIPMPVGTMVDSESLYDADPIARPYVLKPVNEGSSVGVAIVTREGNYGNPIARAAHGPWQVFDRLLAEPFIRGPRADHRGARGSCARRHRTRHQQRLLRL
jgi:D-alanine-D-alanine ligase